MSADIIAPGLIAAKPENHTFSRADRSALGVWWWTTDKVLLGVTFALIGLGVIVLVNAVFAFLDQWTSSRLAQQVIFDVRRAMFAHFQKVSLSFMDKTHVGRIMARLQGDVGALQEFLETTTGALGDMVMLIGIAAVYFALRATARIFRAATLMYGKRPNLPELMRWLRSA